MLLISQPDVILMSSHTHIHVINTDFTLSVQDMSDSKY